MLPILHVRVHTLSFSFFLHQKNKTSPERDNDAAVKVKHSYLAYPSKQLGSGKARNVRRAATRYSIAGKVCYGYDSQPPGATLKRASTQTVHSR